MSATIETTHNIILNKINSLIDIANLLDSYYNKPDNTKIVNVIDNLNEIDNDYNMGSIKILTDYFLLEKTNKEAINKDVINKDPNEKKKYNEQKNKFYIEYQTFIKKNNFIGCIDRYYTILKYTFNQIIKCKLNKISKDIIQKIKDLFDIYENSTIVRSTANIVYNRCSTCNKEMKIIENLSEIICTYCGITENLYGTVFEDFQFYYQEGGRTKHGAYEASKHCKFWIERIQARESKEIPESVINSVKKCIKSNKIRNIHDITCKEIREYLKQTKNSNYNEHIPLIRKIITGRSPEQLLDDELQTIIIYFDKAIKIYEEIKPSNKTNVIYHPYIIYKLIEHTLRKKPPIEYRQSKERIYSILGCIHLQARETLIDHDKTWQEICNHIEELDYVPTDSNNQYKDL